MLPLTWNDTFFYLAVIAISLTVFFSLFPDLETHWRAKLPKKAAERVRSSMRRLRLHSAFIALLVSIVAFIVFFEKFGNSFVLLFLPGLQGYWQQTVAFIISSLLLLLFCLFWWFVPKIVLRIDADQVAKTDMESLIESNRLLIKKVNSLIKNIESNKYKGNVDKISA